MSQADAGRLVLAIDVGATSIKMADVTLSGVVASAVRRRPTPYPCSPERLTEWLCLRIATRAISRVGIGFPGDFREGVVCGPGNLSRPNGRDSDADPELDAAWRGYALQARLREETGVDVRVVNDAAMAAQGCIAGDGRELVVTLGTGFGVALVDGGLLQSIPDYGQQVIDTERTYDAALGERARAADGPRWLEDVRVTVQQLAKTWATPRVHLAGGNSQRLRAREISTPELAVQIHGNSAPLRGAARLFAPVG